MTTNLTPVAGDHSSSLASGPGDDDYRSVSGLAVASFVLGLLSPLAFTDPLLLLLPILGIVLAFISLSRIAASEGQLAGRNLAFAACALAVLSATAGFAKDVAEQKLMSRQAQQAARLWFDDLSRQQTDAAMQRTLPDSGESVEDIAETIYGPDPLREYARKPDVRTLSALGGQATVRFYEESDLSPYGGGRQALQQYYAVTYNDSEDRRRTFFVQLTMERTDPAGAGLPRWRVAGSQGGVRPPRHALD